MSNKQNSTIMWAIFIVILTIIGLVTIPKYIALSNELRIAHARNIAAGLTSTTAVNYTQKKYDPSKGIAIKSCKDVTVLINNTLPANYLIADKEIPSEMITYCTLVLPGIAELKFSQIGIR